jgi:glutaredoxin
LLSAILALVTWQRPPALGGRSWTWTIAPRAALAAVVILLLHANYVAPQAEPIGPEDPTVRALAEHLADADVVFYGASWCPHCQQQKALFGASAARLPYVECSLGGPNAPQAAACRNAGVRSYPTWVINGRAYVGEVLSLAQLADASGFPQAASLR